MARRVTSGNEATGWLKLIALALMVIDHVGVIFFPADMLWRMIGRLAYPVYAWCLVVGACRTRSMKRYLLRMLAMFAVSQPLYMAALNHTWDQPNIMLTLAFALCALWGMRGKWCYSQWWAPAGAMLAAHLCNCSYGWKGVAAVILMYLLRDRRWILAAVFPVFCILWEPGGVYVGYHFGITGAALRHPFWGQVVLQLFRVQACAMFALPLMLIRFPRDIRIPAWLGYALYPAHLLALYAAKLLVG